MKELLYQLIQHPLSIRIVLSVSIITIFYITRHSIIYRINKRVEKIMVRHNYRKLTAYLFTTATLVILGFIWIRRINFGIVFSIIGAGLVISLGDVILSFFGWFFLIIRRPFEIGERVQIGNLKGDVVDIRAFYTTLLEIEGWVKEEQSTGRIVHLPNNFIFRNEVFNYTKGFDFIWNEIKINITFESNHAKAREICMKHINEFHDSWAKDIELKIKEAQNTYAIYYWKLTPTVYIKIVDSGVLLSLRYLVRPHNRRFSENLITEKILDEFAKERDIQFAYTTYRLTK